MSDTTQKIRAKDNALGKIHKDYVQYLADRLAGIETQTPLSTADHTGIRNLLKDNNIFIEPDVDNENEHRKEITLTLVGREVTEEDIAGAQGY